MAAFHLHKIYFTITFMDRSFLIKYGSQLRWIIPTALVSFAIVFNLALEYGADLGRASSPHESSLQEIRQKLKENNEKQQEIKRH